ncbi:SDR family NAD(P)-dependent oxidoreductase [Mesorhizobium sp. BR1-1-3]|uniref:SDR family NAD(P)-dependent oxidoreductase n=1 Tax=Mesorhizobium sp. BR1-1-3 TaxID=2876651 RepID=UPI001CD11593|nr:SDR family NAD(P)-dependent oxidoreductase [Mesorhizobium sp. BR1-1-3]MBZ9891491.1 SDR family NAD(P)-dependent oxidoreductase [Mesorhizobium sp. BR1-1-3]
MNTPVWLITGGSSGLGASIAHAALRAGHRVAVTARDSSRLDALAADYPGAVLPLSMDLTSTTEIEAAVAAAEGWHDHINVLVNNAAVGYLALIEEGQDEKVRKLFETNVFGAVAAIRAALPGMRARGSGTIINISSTNGIVAMPSLGYYSASKFALEALTEALAQEVAPLGIRVMSVQPGGMPTGIVSRNLRSPRIEGYDARAHAIMDLLENDRDGALAPSDPHRIAQILVGLVMAKTMPRQLILGPDSWEAITSKLIAQRMEFDAWKDIAYSTVAL